MSGIIMGLVCVTMVIAYVSFHSNLVVEGVNFREGSQSIVSPQHLIK